MYKGFKPDQSGLIGYFLFNWYKKQMFNDMIL